MLKYLQIKKKIIRKFFVLSISFTWDGSHFYPTTTPNKRSLKIPKGQSECVYQRSTDNTMVKKKKYKRTNNDLNKLRLRSERRNQVLFLFFGLLHS
jgi:hypothetical protein